MRSIQLLLQMQEHHVMVDLLKKLVPLQTEHQSCTVDLNFERALHWVMVGAQPTDTSTQHFVTRRCLHEETLVGGVTKGAFDEAQAEAKFNAWKEKKQTERSGCFES